MRSAIRRSMVVGMLLAAGSVPALAFDNFDLGKTPAELFVSDCGFCHRSPAGLGAALDPHALSQYLAVHYTVSPTIADSLATYLVSVRKSGPAGERPQRHSMRSTTQAGTPAGESKKTRHHRGPSGDHAARKQSAGETANPSGDATGSIPAHSGAPGSKPETKSGG